MVKKFLIFCLLAFVASWIYADENTDEAWREYGKGDYGKARACVQKCLQKSKKNALKQQKELRFLKDGSRNEVAALFCTVVSLREDGDTAGFKHILSKKELNDTGTARFIEAEMLRGEKKTKEARKRYQEIIANYEDAYCWDPRGWYWKVADVARDRIETMGTKCDYGDYRSETLAAKAWQALKDKDHQSVELYGNKCIKLYERRAQKMKAKVRQYPPAGQEGENWAMNDVATAYFLLGEKQLSEGKSAEARKMYGKAVEHKFAVCWNPEGWYFNVAEAAQDRIDTMGTKYNYEDYRSARLVAKAWQELEEKDYKGVEIYTKKVIHLFRKKALVMNITVKTFPEAGKEGENWALNDVATSYFILGNRYAAERKFDLAKEMYEEAGFFTYAVCWNPLGWYFKIGEAVEDKLFTMGTKYDYGDYQSRTLTSKSWECLRQNDFGGAALYATKCIRLYYQQAMNMENAFVAKTLTEMNSQNWALNDVSTCYIILGETSRLANEQENARKWYEQAKKLLHAVCWDPKGWYFDVAELAQDKIDALGTAYDYEDYSSQTLAKKAWDCLKNKDTKGLGLYANKCIKLYEAKAKEMNTQTQAAPAKGEEHLNWAVNDVATSYYLLGEMYLLINADTQAKEMYQKAAEFGFALCWDPQGWYFKIAEVAQDKIDLYGTGYSFGDYRSVTLTGKAWEALAEKDWKAVELYSKKCIYLYGQKAQEMQKELSDYAKGSFAPYYWALNDVGTCYFILGEACKQRGDNGQAQQYYSMITNQLYYSQCWDPRGWYWKVSLVSGDRLKEMR